ncbi:hypothetical protein QJS04_geneDACA023370 [Acorus gramineus]|uniref:Uncharacterized protein n=1 Tax=Acorus gramineus TaxID=55184 RepID=A0AAV9A357_ACOGR|nr:hypothetical protein QJS04_geneDACA023370 [Acorus gramineus]
MDVYYIDKLVEQCLKGRRIDGGFTSTGWAEVATAFLTSAARQFLDEVEEEVETDNAMVDVYKTTTSNIKNQIEFKIDINNEGT